MKVNYNIYSKNVNLNKLNDIIMLDIGLYSLGFI